MYEFFHLNGKKKILSKYKKRKRKFYGIFYRLFNKIFISHSHT